MANNNEQFKAFHDAIKATESRKKTLRQNRDALRERRLESISRTIMMITFSQNSVGKDLLQ